MVFYMASIEWPEKLRFTISNVPQEINRYGHPTLDTGRVPVFLFLHPSVSSPNSEEVVTYPPLINASSVYNYWDWQNSTRAQNIDEHSLYSEGNIAGNLKGHGLKLYHKTVLLGSDQILGQTEDCGSLEPATLQRNTICTKLELFRTETEQLDGIIYKL